jgi:hypothetical protein
LPDLILKNSRMNSRKFAMNYGAVLGLCLVAIAAVMWSYGTNEPFLSIPKLHITAANATQHNPKTAP